jgi:hypothetical protein
MRRTTYEMTLAPKPSVRRPKNELSKDDLRATSRSKAGDRSGYSPRARGSTGLVRALVSLGAAAAIAACAHTESTTSPADASPAASATPYSPISAAGASTPGAIGTVPTASTAPAVPTAAATAVPAASHDATATAVPAGPHFYALTESPSVVHAGDSVSFAASTSPDIESVTATVAAYSLPFVRTGSGRFALAFAIPPNVPGMFHGTYALAVTARSHGGASVSRSISVTFL